MDERLFKDLWTLALDSESSFGFRVVACIFHRNKVVSYGFNQDKTHPFQARFAKHEKAIYWHAETNAIHNAIRRVDESYLSKCSLAVARVKFDINGVPGWGLAKPCKGCQRCINQYSLKSFHYTMNGPVLRVQSVFS